MSVWNELEMTVGHATDWTKGALEGAISVLDTAAAGLGPAVGAAVNAPFQVAGGVAKGVGRTLSLGLQAMKRQSKP